MLLEAQNETADVITQLTCSGEFFLLNKGDHRFTSNIKSIWDHFFISLEKKETNPNTELTNVI